MYQVYAPLKYCQLKIGDAELKYDGRRFHLFYQNRFWMGYDTLTGWQSSEFIIELNHAKGVCVTTGLGLGILQTLLLKSEKVEKVVVYEKNQDIIDLFLAMVEFNKFDISKLVIINQDAGNIKDTKSECLFIDHFESDPYEKIISSVKFIAANNQTNFLWYWPGSFHFLEFCEAKQIPCTMESYALWKLQNNLEFLPSNLDEDDFNSLLNLKQKYLEDTAGRFNKRLNQLKKRNTMIEIFENNKRANYV